MTSWKEAALACARHCLACERCQYTTISLQEQDCSWYSECQIDRLHHDGRFKSARMRSIHAEPLTAALPPPAPVTAAGSSAKWPPCTIYVHDPGWSFNQRAMHTRSERWSDKHDYWQLAFALHTALKGYEGRTLDPAAADVVFIAHYFQVHLPRSVTYAGGPLYQWDRALKEGGPSALFNHSEVLLRRWSARPADFVAVLISQACGFARGWLRSARWMLLEPLGYTCGFRHRFDVIAPAVISRPPWAPWRLTPARHKTHFLTYVGRMGKPYIMVPVCQVRLKMWGALRDHPNATILATDYEDAIRPQLRTANKSCAVCSYGCKQCLDPRVYGLPEHGPRQRGVLPRVTSTAEYQEYFLNSTFCLMMRGDYEGSLKFTEIILAGCVPVLISDMPAWPFAQRLDYRSFSYEFDWQEASARPLGVMERLLRVPAHEYAAKHAALMRVRARFFYSRRAERRSGASAERELIKDLCAARGGARAGGPSDDREASTKPARRTYWQSSVEPAAAVRNEMMSLLTSVVGRDGGI